MNLTLVSSSASLSRLISTLKVELSLLCIAGQNERLEDYFASINTHSLVGRIFNQFHGEDCAHTALAKLLYQLV